MSIAIARREVPVPNTRRLLAERERIARALQRGTIHRLFGIGLTLQALSARGADPSVSKRLDECVRELDLAIFDLRGVVFKEEAGDA